MANKRIIKKAVKQLSSDLLVECVAIAVSRPSIKEDARNVMAEIFIFHSEMLARINHIEPGMGAKEYFRSMKAYMVKRANEIGDQLYALA